MSIDTEKNRDLILKAFNDVVSDKKATNWALFGYEGQTNVLKLVGTGEDGLEELAEDLNSSKIMYAAVKVIDPNTTRPKIVLINWQGEGAPTVRKGTCARHLNDIHKLLRGVHVTVNARTEEEVEPEVVMAAVLKASATTYNFNERSEMNDKTTPVRGLVDTFKKGEAAGAVGTNYKRTNPLAEIDSRSRNKFWEEQEAEEKRRKVEEQQRRDEELKQLENERKQREISETQRRESLTRERNARILAERKAEEAAAQRLASKQDQKWQQELESQQREEVERARRAEIMRLERKKEAESLIGQRTHSTRDMFESGIKNNTQQTTDRNRPPPRRLKEFKPVNSQTREEGKENNPSAPSRGVAARWPPASSDSPQQVSTPTQCRGDRATPTSIVNASTPIQDTILAQSSPPAPPIKQPPESIHSHPEVTNTGYVRNLLREGLPTQPTPDGEESSAKDEWEDKSREVHHSIPHHAQPNHNTNNNQTYHQFSEPSHQQLSFNQSSYHPSSPNPTSPHQEDPVTFQVPSAYTNESRVSEMFEDTAVEMFKPNYHNGVEDKSVYDYVDHTAAIKASSNSTDNTFEVAVQQSNSTTSGISSNSTTPAVGMVYEVDGMEYQILPEHGLCARALYDYQAADETEITFDPSEIITNIDQIDEGWWQGVGPDGMFGLFPANYVELINQPTV
ncbi:drebrin-like protein isoform X2 [Panulirus ornatus]|uniref:drebrin-like protein isoform X2 n=1 Tax=Panulirus ornatus TaxID=150431 RepID=UPI003A87DDA3